MMTSKEALDKLEECAYAMKDLPMSNWIDLANSEAELDLKIMNWVETIKLELFKGKQALQRLEAIDNTNPSEALMFIQELLNISETEKHFINLANYDTRLNLIKTKQALIKAQEQEKILSVILKKRIDLESFYSTFVKDDLDYKYYEKYYGTYGLEKLTKEEFDLLREVNNDEKQRLYKRYTNVYK